MTIRPNFPTTLVNRGLVELALGKPEDALKELRKAIYHGEKDADKEVPLIGLILKRSCTFKRASTSAPAIST